MTANEGEGSNPSSGVDIRHAEIVLRLQYADASGAVTERAVTALQIRTATAGDGPPHLTHLFAYCHLRRRTRMFALDRVQEAVDLTTGEVLPDLTRWLCAQLDQPEARRGPDGGDDQ